MKILVMADRWSTRPLRNILEENSDIKAFISLWDLYYNDLKDLEPFPNLIKIWVLGNHDMEYERSYMKTLWIENLHWKTKMIWGLLFAWIGWCPIYKPWKHDNQYSQSEISDLLKNMPKADVLIAHSNPYWINDNGDYYDDPAHVWFLGIKELLDSEKAPKIFIHWHSYENERFINGYNNTKIIYIHWDEIVYI